ncbi:MAG: TonB-dependent receptor [Flavobacteriales bacterium]|nr:TonB-dependent receptor [Flavobacteriales bacterium]
MQFGNSAATLRWNHIFGQKLFSNTSLIYNTYLQDISTRQDNSFSQTYSGINDITGKTEFHYYPNQKHTIKMGAQFTGHRFISSGRSQTIIAGTKIPDLNVLKIPAKHVSEYAVYISDEFTLSDRISLNYGIRAPGFSSSNVTYNKLEPRATIKAGIDSTSSIKASYTQMNQFIHLIPNSTATLPSDIYIPSSKLTKPQFSTQYSIGYFRNFKENNYETSVEVYYKDMDNQVLYGEGNQLTDNSDLDKGLVYGKGESYGAEFFVKKNSGRLNGWVSYTLSWTNQ